MAEMSHLQFTLQLMRLKNVWEYIYRECQNKYGKMIIIKSR